MHSDAETVDDYIASFDGAEQEALKDLRSMIQSAAPSSVESMKYKMPTYNHADDVFAFAVQKRYLSVYINKADLIAKHASKLGKHDRGKNCVRFAKPNHMDREGMSELIREAYS